MRRTLSSGARRPFNANLAAKKKLNVSSVPTAVVSAVQQGKVPTGSVPPIVSVQSRVDCSHTSVTSVVVETRQRLKRRGQRLLAKAVEDAQSQAHPNHSYFTVVQRGKFTPELRRGVIGWMQRCALHFQLLPETLEVAIHMFDRFLSLVHIPGDKHVRVVGVTCVFLATKLSESMEDGPALRDLVIASGGAFSVNDIMRMERIVLSKLTWNVGNIVTNTHVAELTLGALTQADNDALSAEQHRQMLQCVHAHLGDVQTDATFMRFRPNEIAAAAVIVAAIHTTTAQGLDMKRVYSLICELTNTEAHTISECVDALNAIAADATPLF